jgi:membrane protease YdiL (CAAX protease family)
MAARGDDWRAAAETGALLAASSLTVYGLRAALTHWFAAPPAALLLDPDLAPHLTPADFPWVDCLAMLIGFGALPIAWEWFLHHTTPSQIGFRAANGRFLWLGTGVGLALWGWGHLAAWLLGLPIPRTLAVGNATVLGVAWVCTVTAEEVFFRGFIQRHLTDCVGLGVALTAASAAFAFIPHLQADPRINLLVRLPAGVALGLLYHRTRSLLPPFLAHWLLNVLAALG